MGILHTVMVVKVMFLAARICSGVWKNNNIQQLLTIRVAWQTHLQMQKPNASNINMFTGQMNVVEGWLKMGNM